MSKNGFEGSLEEFEKAISLHNSSENKMAVHHANLALESCIKTILGIEKEKPGKLIRKLIDSGTVPIYYKDFLQNFEQVLRVVTVTRNEEKGAGHGQGVSINEIPNKLRIGYSFDLGFARKPY